MKKFLSLLAVLFLPFSASAQEAMIATLTEDGSVVLRLEKTPCLNETLSTVVPMLKAQEPSIRGKWYSGSVKLMGEPLEICWTKVTGEPSIFVVDESGGMGFVPLDKFVSVVKE